MAHDVFISYSSKDMAQGEAVCAALERNGISCWMAPRDIVPGIGWAKSIIQAINGARAMVLVLSAHANESPQVEREVERAINKGVPVIPLRIENVPLSDALEYFLSAPHWLDAYHPPLEPHLERLAIAVRTLLGTPEPSRTVRSQPSAQPSPVVTKPVAATPSIAEPPRTVRRERSARPSPVAKPPVAATPSIAEPRAFLPGVVGAERKAMAVGALASVSAVVVVLAAAVIVVLQTVPL